MLDILRNTGKVWVEWSFVTQVYLLTEIVKIAQGDKKLLLIIVKKLLH